jgi:hypothetical protein
MSVPRVAAVVVVAASLCSKAYAAIYGSYPGLRSLIKADVIAAVTILKQLSEEDIGGSARYKIQFEKVLKGKPPEKLSPGSESLRSSLRLRWSTVHRFSRHRLPAISVASIASIHFVRHLGGLRSSRGRKQTKTPRTRTSIAWAPPFRYHRSETWMN